MIFIGYDPRPIEAVGFAVARYTARRNLTRPIPINGLILEKLKEQGLYSRPTEIRVGSWIGKDGKKWHSSEPVLWDVISQWTMSTEFAISRFLVPELVRRSHKIKGEAFGWALFMDGDVLIRRNITDLFDIKSDCQKYAVMVVKQVYEPEAGSKMDGQVQTKYSRKNWSSVMLFNCDHPANKLLDVGLVNEAPGRELHAFSWLDNKEIGELGPEYNLLVGNNHIGALDPKIVHFTEGLPILCGFENVPYAEEWRQARNEWASR